MEHVDKDLEAVQSMLSQKTVAHELQYLRQLFTCPPGMFEQAHATIAALENLVDTARENADADTLARLGCGSCLFYVPSSPAIYRLFTLRFSSPRFLFFVRQVCQKPLAILLQGCCVAGRETLTSGRGLLSSNICVATGQYYANVSQISFRDLYHFFAANLQNHQPGDLFWLVNPRLRNCQVNCPSEQISENSLSILKVPFRGNTFIASFLPGTFSLTVEIVLITNISSPPASMIESRMAPFQFMARSVRQIPLIQSCRSPWNQRNRECVAISGFLTFGLNALLFPWTTSLTYPVMCESTIFKQPQMMKVVMVTLFAHKVESLWRLFLRVEDPSVWLQSQRTYFQLHCYGCHLP